MVARRSEEHAPFVLHGRNALSTQEQLQRDAQLGRIVKFVGKGLLGVLVVGLVVNCMLALRRPQGMATTAQQSSSTRSMRYPTVLATEEHLMGSSNGGVSDERALKFETRKQRNWEKSAEARKKAAEEKAAATQDDSNDDEELQTLQDNFGDVVAAPSPVDAPGVRQAKETPTLDLDDAWPCKPGEEIWNSLCFKTCKSLTNNKFPIRVDHCQCCESFPCPMTLESMATDCTVLSVDIEDKMPRTPLLTDCGSEDEELFQGMCYLQCKILTYGKFPLRTGSNTCSRDGFGANFTMGLGYCTGFAVGKTSCWPKMPSPRGTAIKMSPPAEPGQAPGGLERANIGIQTPEMPAMAADPSGLGGSAPPGMPGSPMESAPAALGDLPGLGGAAPPGMPGRLA